MHITLIFNNSLRLHKGHDTLSFYSLLGKEGLIHILIDWEERSYFSSKLGNSINLSITRYIIDQIIVCLE